MANSISQRKDTMNNIFVTLNLAIIAAVSITWNIKSLFILVAGIVVCVIWLLFIRNCKLLNTEKFNVINSIEKNLPVQPFNDVWEKLKNNKKYTDGTKLVHIAKLNGRVCGAKRPHSVSEQPIYTMSR